MLGGHAIGTIVAMSRAAGKGFQLPAAALEWLVGQEPSRVLTLSGTGLPRTMARHGHDVFALDRSPRVLSQLANEPGVTPIAAQAEQLPFDPCQFDLVVSHQVFHRYAPGLVLSEMARVLRPGGHVAVSYLVRDDSVPWVRRLVGMIRELDPDAMAGSFGAESVEELVASKYFHQVEKRNFRHWVPISREAMLRMTSDLPAVQGLAERERTGFLDEVGQLFDDSAPGIGDLRLPYQLRCWRAEVNHEELTAPIAVDDDGLVIPL